jgi:hypothetical protein
MGEERNPGIGPGGWLKELENRLQKVGARLEDAALQLARSSSQRAEVGRHLSALQELVARIEDRIAMLTAEASAGQSAAGIADPCEGTVDVPGFPGYRVGSDGRVWGSRRAGRGYVRGPSRW